MKGVNQLYPAFTEMFQFLIGSMKEPHYFLSAHALISFNSL